MIAALLCTALAGLSVGTAYGQKAAPADGKAVAACLKKAEEAGQYPGRCIGIVADPCIDVARTKASYREDSKACAARELAVWSALMAEALKRGVPVADKRMTAAITESQKAFALSRDTLCPIYDNVDPDMALGGANYCRLQETARRALMLRRLADAINEH
ncbi:MAG: DUF1311 domain-containing protein [Pseudorhodoplanes sp.]|nr:DUF1311 domain-containing protein [Pseudorhodoplanes sp.]